MALQSGDEGWNQFTAVLNLGIELYTVYSGISEHQAAEFKFESKFEPLHVIWHLAITPEGCQCSRWQTKVWPQNQGLSSLGSAFAQHCRVWVASTNTGHFRIGGSRCWPQLARLKKICYHSCNNWRLKTRKICYHPCNTELVWKSKRF